MRIILSQIAQMTQTNAAGCIISQRKTDWVGGVVVGVIVVLGFVCVNQRDLRETLGAFLCRLIVSSCVLFSRRLRRYIHTYLLLKNIFSNRQPN